MEETRDELIDKLGPYFISDDNVPQSFLQQLNRNFKDIHQRLIEAEFYQGNNGKKPEVSRAEKMLFMSEIGLIEYLFDKGWTQKRIALVLSMLINSSATNIETDLSSRHDKKSRLKTKSNYQFLVEMFKELKLENDAERCQNELDKLED